MVTRYKPTLYNTAIMTRSREDQVRGGTPDTKQLTLKTCVAKQQHLVLHRSAEMASYGTNDSVQSTKPVLISRIIVWEM